MADLRSRLAVPDVDVSSSGTSEDVAVTKDAIIILCATLGGAALFGGIEAAFGSHDPGAVFPWAFVAVILAIAGAVAGFLGSLAFLVLRFAFRTVLGIL